MSEVERVQQVLRVGLPNAGRIRHGPDVVGVGAAELLAREVPLDLALQGRRERDPGRLVEADEDGLGVDVARADMHRGGVGLGLQHVPGDGGRRDAQVGDVDAGGVQPRDHRPLDHAARGRGITARHDTGAALQRRPERGREAGGGLRRQVDVDEARHPVLAEQPRRRTRLPDQVLVELRAGLHLLVRVDPDVRHDARLGADRHLVADRRAFVDAHVVADVAGAPDDRALDQRAAPDVRRSVDHGSRRARALAQRDAVRQHRVRADRGVAGDPAVVADERGALDLLDVVHVGSLADPHVSAQPDAADVQPHRLVQGVEVRLPVLVEIADVLPVAVEHVPVDRAAHLEQEREELLREVVRPVGRDVLQHLRLEDVDAGVDRVGEHLPPRRLLEEPLDAAVVARHDDPELERVVDRLQPDRDRRSRLLVARDERAEVDVAERVAGDHEEGLVELGAREPDRAGRSERELLDRVLHVQAHRLAVAEVAADRLGQERERDHDVLEPVAAEELEDVLHARLADDRHHRLGLVRRERTQPRALAAGHDDRLHGVTSRRASTTYCAAATSARPSAIQKSQSGHSVAWPATIRMPTER